MTDRAGYTVTMFLVDVSPSMGKMREVEIPLPNGEVQIAEMTNLEWALQFVKLKVQEMIYHERKTDQCGILLFGSDKTDNHVSRTQGGYDHIEELMPIAHPTAKVISQISAVTPSTEIGDPLDALVVGIETQDNYLGKKKWTRKIVLLTDAENPIEIQHLDRISQRLNELKIRLTVIGIDFDDEEFGYVEEDKSDIKRENEDFYHSFVATLDEGVVGNCAVAIEEISRPEAKQTRSLPSASVLRLGDAEHHPAEAVEINVKICKCTALVRPKAFKKFAKLSEDVAMRDADDDAAPSVEYGQLTREIRYSYDPTARPAADDDDMDEDDEKKPGARQDVEKEALVRGYKYGASFVPVPENSFPKLDTKRGMEICGFFREEYFRREWCLDEVRYVFAAERAPLQQVALASLVDGMYQETKSGAKITFYAVTRWVATDGAEPKMGVLKPMKDDAGSRYFLWVQMPFADDIRKWTFPSLDHLISSKGARVTTHPYIPTARQLDAMDALVAALDLMAAGEKDDDGNRTPWYDTRLSYSPAVHRTKQAQFHAAVVEDLARQPLPPPHPELLKYFDPPRRVLRRARPAADAAREAFGVKEVPRAAARRKDGHVRARDDGDDALLLDRQPKRIKLSQSQMQSQYVRSQRARASPPTQRKPMKRALSDDSDTEPEREPEPADDDDDMPTPKPAAAVKVKREPKPEPAEHGVPPSPRSPSPRDRAPGRIIGTTRPLEEFYENTARGDLVSKAVEDLAFAVRTVLFRPFAGRRADEMLQCVRALRRVALEEDEVDAWNDFLRDLRRRCLDDAPGNAAFWAKLAAQGREVSLIGASEARAQGGRSDVADAEADEFLSSGMAE